MCLKMEEVAKETLHPLHMTFSSKLSEVEGPARAVESSAKNQKIYNSNNAWKKE